MSDNLRHWEALRKVDPKHTKGFQRSGGFKGTALKPIYLTKMLTEHFGPCGIGWGMTQPTFQVVAAGDETLVYCTVGLWYREGEKQSETVFGVGGDKAVGKNKHGAFTDDEAFKKAYTDALSNAMKQLGVGADVHMGLFDDAKYVDELRKEFAEDDTPASSQRPTASATPPVDSEDALKAEARKLAERLKKAPDVNRLHQVMDDGRELLKKVPQDIHQYLGKLYETRLAAMETPS